MKTKIIHPLWVHLPSLIVIAIAVYFTIKALPLPDTAPIHFDISGTSNDYGSPWLSIFLTIGLSAGFLAISVLFDELWARQEKGKHFNWLSLCDEFVIADLCAIEIAYVNMLAAKSTVFLFPWMELVLLCIAATGMAVFLESQRPYRPYRKVLTVEDSSLVKAEVDILAESGQPLDYHETQNPAYVGALAIIIPVIMLAGAVACWTPLPWLSIILLISSAGMFLIYGGLRTLVTRERVTVKLGIFGITLLDLKTVDITEVDVHSFAPLKDFGGYGIRSNPEMQAFFFKGDQGVKLTAGDGKKYLIGSDRPLHLAAVIKAVAGL